MYPKDRPRVLIVGRPNVGKSTLFNRLVGQRRAITDPTPGVTRDAIEEPCVLSGKSFILVDTGGITTDGEGDFDRMVTGKALSILVEAHVIIFLFDLSEWTAEDQIITDLLRPYTKKVVLVANKSDIPEKDYLAMEYCSLGFGTPIPVSGTHGRGMDRLIDTVIHHLPETSHESPVNSDIALGLIGKPNVGKSTLANFLAKKECSLVSEIAGTTRDTVMTMGEYKGRILKIIDTAGIRRKNKVYENVEYYAVNRSIKSLEEVDVSLLIIDHNEGLTGQDKKIAGQALKKGSSLVLVLNKWDEESPDRKKLKEAVDAIYREFPVLKWAPVVPISSRKGYGVQKMLDVVFQVDQQQRVRIGTGELNRILARWMEFTPPPSRGHKKFKIRYISQVSVKPVRFVIFVNRTEGFPESYIRFLTNQLRAEFGFDHVPVELKVKEAR